MPKAVEYILNIYDTIPSLDESLQMSIIEVIRLDCKSDSAHRVSDCFSLVYHRHADWSAARRSRDTFGVYSNS